MDHNLWEQGKSAFYQLSAWVGRQLAGNPLLLTLGAIGVILVLWWALKPKFRD
jgi:hypothetical protein